MIDFIRKIIKAKYETLNSIEIIQDNLIYNINYLYSKQKQAEMFPVLKSNAYGHGLKEVCQILNKTKVKMVAIDSFPEAQIAYKYFKGKVLVLGEMSLKAYKHSKLKRTEFLIYNEKTLKYLAKFKKKAKIHLFFNSGMNREGIDNLDLFIKNNEKYLNKVDVVGFCSHLAEADNSSSSYNQEQEERFLKGLEILNNHKFYPKWIHLGNSGGVFILKNKTLTAFRPGIALYGYNPLKEGDEKNNETANLKPSLRLYSTIIALHKLKTGDKVSYANSFELKESSNIAVIPFGYSEGLDRRLSNSAKFIVNEDKNPFWAKIAGNISMNLCCINCLNRDIEIYDKVKIISEEGKMDNSVDILSDKAGMLNYEFLTKLNSNIKRKII
jgi:alanine racemase